LVEKQTESDKTGRWASLLRHVGDDRAKRWTKLLVTFLTGQSLVQGLNLVTGFLLLRWMSVESYAQYTVATAFQGTISMLADLGVSGSIVALVGTRFHERETVGAYVRTARAYRGRLFFVMATVTVFAFPLVTQNQAWPVYEKLLLVLGVLAQIFFSAWGMYSAPLLMHRRLSDVYRAGIFPAAARLIASGLIHLLDGLTGWAITMVTAASTALGGWMTRRAAQGLLVEPKRADSELAQEMTRHLSVLWPGMIYYALQAQITPILLSIGGQSAPVAEVGALGRLSQVYLLFSGFQGVVIIPMIAATPFERLRVKYFSAVTSFVVMTLLFPAIAIIWPSPFIWLLGPNYSGLGSLIGWSLLSSSIASIGGLIYSLNAARRWMYKSMPYIYIGVGLFVQVSFVALYGLTSVSQAIAFGIVGGCSGLIIHIIYATLGYRAEHARVRV